LNHTKDGCAVSAILPRSEGRDLSRNLGQAMGVRALIVNAKDASAAAFYQGYGFQQMASEALTLYLPV